MSMEYMESVLEEMEEEVVELEETKELEEV